MVALLANFFLFRHSLRQQRQIRQRLESLQQLLTSAYREMPADRFAAWLAGTDFQAWTGSSGNIAWILPPATVRWSLRPIADGDFFPDLLDAIREAARSPGTAPRRVSVRDGARVYQIRIHRLSDTDSEAGLLMLRAPRSHLFIDAYDLWMTASLLALLLLGFFLFYQRSMRRQIRRLIDVSVADLDIPFPGPGEALDAWAQQYVDITSRKLDEERGLFESLFDILQDGILFLDAENRILRANPTAARILDRQPAALIGLDLPETARQTALGDLAASIRSSGAYQSAELYLPTISGPGHVAGIPLRTHKADEAPRLMLVMRDLSQVRRLESAGEEYATNVSHELKTPLTLILGYTETLLSHNVADPEFRERSLRTIEHHTKRIIRIIDDLMRLAWLRNEAESVGIPRTTVSVPKVIEDAVTICREWAQSAGIDIETHIPENLTWKLNSGLIEEALVNLVKNAILYALTGPVEIRVRVLPGGNLEIAIVDRGPGLKPEDAQRIFERFYRADKSRSRASGGSGLGLPIVQQIIVAHNGTTRVESTPGEGCTFILEIPPAPPSEQSASTPPGN